MKSTYYVSKIAQFSGDHEVHVRTCQYFPEHRLELGEFEACSDAVRKAKQTYPLADGCRYCLPACHTR